MLSSLLEMKKIESWRDWPASSRCHSQQVAQWNLSVALHPWEPWHLCVHHSNSAFVWFTVWICTDGFIEGVPDLWKSGKCCSKRKNLWWHKIFFWVDYKVICPYSASLSPSVKAGLHCYLKKKKVQDNENSTIITVYFISYLLET